MKGWQAILFLVVAAIVVLCGLFYGGLCLFVPRRAILLQAKFSTLLTEDSASDPSLLLQCRALGLALIIGVSFFGLIITGKALEMLK